MPRIDKAGRLKRAKKLAQVLLYNLCIDMCSMPFIAPNKKSIKKLFKYYNEQYEEIIKTSCCPTHAYQYLISSIIKYN